MTLRRILAVALLACVASAAAGCSRTPPPEPLPSPTSPTSSATTVLPTEIPTPPPPTSSPTPSVGGSTPTSTAATCAGRPTATEILTLLRQRRLVEANANVSVTTGPLCADSWHYTVVAVPDADPLQVVTRYEGTQLTLVTAGTDLCEDLTTAPPAIRMSAHC